MLIFHKYHKRVQKIDCHFEDNGNDFSRFVQVEKTDEKRGQRA